MSYCGVIEGDSTGRRVKKASVTTMGLTADQEALLPTDEDVDFYEEHGYYVSRKVLPDEVIDAAVRGAERHWSASATGGFRSVPDRRLEALGRRYHPQLRVHRSLQDREIRSLVEVSVIGAIAARLTRSDEIRLWDDQLVSKPASSGPSGPVVGWHTDRAYWMTCTSEGHADGVDPAS